MHECQELSGNAVGKIVCVTKTLSVEECQMTNGGGELVQISLEASVSANNTPALRKLLQEHVHGGARRMALDFTSVESIDSVGIGLLVATHNSLAKVGGSLSLANVGQDIYQLLTLMRLDKHFSIVQASVVKDS